MLQWVIHSMCSLRPTLLLHFCKATADEHAPASLRAILCWLLNVTSEDQTSVQEVFNYIEGRRGPQLVFQNLSG